MADDSTRPPSTERRALHLAVSDFCNNSCLFCLNARVDGRIGRAPPRAPTWEQIRGALEEGYQRVGLREVIFTIAEPTMSAHLVDAVRLAADLGYERIAMNTNGRRLGEGDLAARLLEAGMNAIMLSVHGPNAEIHDRLVGRAGAFEQVVAGLTQLRAHRPARGFVLQMLCVLGRINLPHLEGMYRFFLRHARPEHGDHLSFTCLKMLGLGATRFDELGVRYAPLAREWLRVWRALGAPRDMRLSEIPWCAVVAVGDDGLALPPIDVPDRRFVAEPSHPQGDPRAATRDALSDVPAPTVVAPTLRGTDYVHRAACAQCLLEPSCSGVLRGYAERFGWDELPPVRVLPAAVAARGRRGTGPIDRGGVGRATALGSGARELIGDLLGLNEEGWNAVGLEPAGLGEERGELWFSLRSVGRERGELTLTVFVGEPDPERPAFVRTAELRVYYQATGQPKLATRLMRRLARVVARTKLDELRGAWRRTMAARAPERGPAALTPDAPAPLFGHASLATRLGDSACGMMGAVEILGELPDRLGVLVHGDRGCLPTPESPSPGLYTTDLTDLDLVRGGEERALEAARRIVELDAPRAVVLVGTCLGKMIGEDLAQIARSIEESERVPTVALDVSGLESLRPFETTDRAYAALGRRFLKTDERPRGDGEGTVALVGYPTRRGAFEEELGTIARGAGVALGARFPEEGLDALARLGSASALLTPERVACRSLLGELEQRYRVAVIEQPTPIGLGLTSAFFRALARTADETRRAPTSPAARTAHASDRPGEGSATRMEQLLGPRIASASARIAQFRARHAGQRAVCAFGGTHKGASLAACTHLGLGHVPLLVELGLVVDLALLSAERDLPREELAALAQRLGASPGVQTYPQPELLADLLATARPDLVVVEDCHKHHADHAGVAYLALRGFEPGFAGIDRTIDALELLLP